MKQKIRIGIVGYGNLGKGAELAVQQAPDMELVAVFSRRALGATDAGGVSAGGAGRLGGGPGPADLRGFVRAGLSKGAEGLAAAAGLAGAAGGARRGNPHPARLARLDG